MQIAARQSFLTGRAGPSTPTARDYVQNGLIAMWDGVENAGWGQHDSSATAWADLTGNHDALRAEAGSAISFGVDCAIMSTTTKVANIPAPLMVAAANNQALTAEVLFKWAAYVNDDTYFSINNGAGERGLWLRMAQRGFVYNAQGIFAGVEYRRLAFYPTDIEEFPAAGAYHRIVCVAGVQGVAIYLDGAYVGTVANGGMAMTGGYFSPTNRLGSTISTFSEKSYHAIRVYSRALTAAEVAANYAIDAARFGL